MKIYLASSWKNADQVIRIKQRLVMQGHEVDAFCDKSAGRFVFSFDLLPNVEKMTAETVLKEEIVRRAFEEDRKWLDWADTCVLILPAGNSAHLEAGYAKGSGKKLVIYRENFPQGEFDVMYGFADLVTEDMERVIEFLGMNKSDIAAKEVDGTEAGERHA